MYPRGHAGISLILTSPIVLYMGRESLLTSTMICLIIMWSSILPDVDIIEKSLLSDIKHRGPTHTIWFATFTYILSYFIILILDLYYSGLEPYVHIIPASMFTGVLLHLMTDIMNETGVRPLKIGEYFSDFRLRYDVFESDGCMNNLFFVVGFIKIISCTLLTGFS